jgi:hypothetical protein
VIIDQREGAEKKELAMLKSLELIEIRVKIDDRSFVWNYKIELQKQDESF